MTCGRIERGRTSRSPEVRLLPVPAPAGGSLTTDPASSARPRTASVAVAAAAWTLALLSIALLPITEPSWHPGQWYFLVDLADAVIFGAVASVLLTRGRHVVAWLLALCAVGGGFAALGFQWSAARAVHPDLCLLYTSPSPRDQRGSRMPSSA